MYNNGYDAASPPLTNNPFSNDPRNPHTRFPDISSPSQDPTNGQYPPWPQTGVSNGYAAQQQQPGYYQQPYQQQPAPYNDGYTQTGYLGPTPGLSPQQPSQPFQPTSSFGQQLAGQVSGSSYGYLQGQSTGLPQQTGYHPAQQQIQNNPGYVAQFDPYASIGQGWDGQAQNQSLARNQAIQSPSYGNFSTSTSPPGNSHPREYIRTHKAEIEAWDDYAWKQLLNAFDALRDAWDARKREIGGKIGQLQAQMQYGAGGFYGQIQQEGLRLQGLMRESESNSDSVAASSFQMHEVFQGYRQSADLASKRRVREASNAALQSLPDWPSQVY